MGFGVCDLDRHQTICEGDMNACARSGPRKVFPDARGREMDRRRFPRFFLDLPLEYREMNDSSAPQVRGALVVDASEGGLLIESLKDISPGTGLDITVMFPKGYELAALKLAAAIVRKEPYWKEHWQGYRYGLEFIRILKEDRWRWQFLLEGRLN
jgi:hypothetical protein